MQYSHSRDGCSLLRSWHSHEQKFLEPLGLPLAKQLEGPSFAQIVHFVVVGAGAGVSTVGFVGSVGW